MGWDSGACAHPSGGKSFVQCGSPIYIKTRESGEKLGPLSLSELKCELLGRLDERRLSNRFACFSLSLCLYFTDDPKTLSRWLFKMRLQ